MVQIKILDKDTAEQIAAGEVIENPASVVKELVENALDAGATKVVVLLEEGGKSYISVTDNGHGISVEDLPLAFQRFATSKLSTFDDLDHLSSLGFRGEALPSIAAIARVKLTTRPENALAASQIVVEGGSVTEQTEVGAPPGTMVEVSDLFFNTPGRRKFLRAASFESSRVSSLITEMALANPAVSFELKSGGRNLFRSGGDGNLLHTIASLYGSDNAEAMLTLNRNDKTTGSSLTGFTSSPYLTRSSRKWITVIVNGRLVNNAMIVNALERAYGEQLPGRRHPLAVLHLHLPSASIDVNVHPAKTEIRFHQPETVKNLVYKTVKLTLQGSVQLPSWPESTGEHAYSNQDHLHQVSVLRESKFSGIPFSYEKYLKSEPTPIEGSDSNPQTDPEKIENISPDHNTGDSHLIGQYLNSYLVVQKGENLLLIDQHAAHEIIIYQQLAGDINGSKARGSSQLTIPYNLELPAKWRDKLDQILPVLKELGFELEPLGENNYAVRAVPFMLRANPGSSELYDLLESLLEADDGSPEQAKDIVLKTIACHRSVKAKQKLSRSEMELLLREWEETPGTHYCPHGRPAVLSFDRARLEKGFHRGGGF
jgi:DNA mismatch repair protein MutL